MHLNFVYLPESCSAGVVDVYVRLYGSLTVQYVVIPLNPLVHPVNVLVVTPVYVIISSSIFKDHIPVEILWY